MDIWGKRRDLDQMAKIFMISESAMHIRLKPLGSILLCLSERRVPENCSQRDAGQREELAAGELSFDLPEIRTKTDTGERQDKGPVFVLKEGVDGADSFLAGQRLHQEGGDQERLAVVRTLDK